MNCTTAVSLKEKTNYQFKILYALGIIFIVAGHCGGGGISLFYDWFPPYAFHLALFMFCSGYFIKNKYSSHPFKYIIKKARRLLIPLFAWNCFYAFVVFILSTRGFTIGAPVTIGKLTIDVITNGHQFGYNLGGWFVIPLFFSQSLYILIQSILSRKRNRNAFILDTSFLIISFLFGGLSICLATQGIKNDWILTVVRTLFLFPFLYLGSYYKKYLEKFDTSSSLKYFTIIFAIMFIIIITTGKAPVYYPSTFSNFNDGPVLPFVVAVTGVAFWLRISRLITPVIGKSKIVNILADNTYSIMINQYAGFMVLKTLFALLSKLFILHPQFDWPQYKTNINYLYTPGNISQTRILYLIAGLSIPILMQSIVNSLLKIIAKRKSPRL